MIYVLISGNATKIIINRCNWKESYIVNKENAVNRFESNEHVCLIDNVGHEEIQKEDIILISLHKLFIWFSLLREINKI